MSGRVEEKRECFARFIKVLKLLVSRRQGVEVSLWEQLSWSTQVQVREAGEKLHTTLKLRDYLRDVKHAATHDGIYVVHPVLIMLFFSIQYHINIFATFGPPRW